MRYLQVAVLLVLLASLGGLAGCSSAANQPLTPAASNVDRPLAQVGGSGSGPATSSTSGAGPDRPAAGPAISPWGWILGAVGLLVLLGAAAGSGRFRATSPLGGAGAAAGRAGRGAPTVSPPDDIAQE